MGEGVVDARQLWSKLRQRKPYKPQQEESLKLHAEKKALAMLLSNNGEDKLSITINFNACMAVPESSVAILAQAFWLKLSCLKLSSFEIRKPKHQ